MIFSMYHKNAHSRFDQKRKQCLKKSILANGNVSIPTMAKNTTRPICHCLCHLERNAKLVAIKLAKCQHRKPMEVFTVALEAGTAP